MIAAVGTLLGKELRELWRDKRTLFASLNFALVGPVVLVAVVYGIAAANRTAQAGDVRWCGAGVGSIALARYLENEGYRFVAGAPLCLSVPGDLEARVRRSRPVEIGVRADMLAHEAAAKRVASDLEAIGASIGVTRLLARGVTPGIERPFRVTLQNLGPADATSNSVVSVLVLYFLLAPFFACLSSAIDTTAGERERGTIEPLLVQPVTPLEIVVAKWISLSLLGVVGAAVTIALGLWSLQFAPLSDAGVTVDLTPAVTAQAILIVAPLAFVVAALQLWIGLQAKTYKEGQNNLTLVTFLPMILGVTAFRDVPERLRAVPFLHEIVAVKALLWGQPAAFFAPVTVLLSLLALVLLLGLAAAQLRRAALVHA